MQRWLRPFESVLIRRSGLAFHRQLAERKRAGVGGGLDDAMHCTGRASDTDLGALQLRSGRICSEKLTELARRQMAAAAAEDYERAGQLRDLLETLRVRTRAS